jgi:hypothetical protein
LNEHKSLVEPPRVATRLLIIVCVGGILAAGLLRMRWDNVDRTELSDRWHTEYRGAPGVDGRGRTNLVRKTGKTTRVVANDVYRATFVGDDCVIYDQRGLFGVCGDLPPIFVGLLPGDLFSPQATSFKGEGEQVYTVDAIKEAARNVEEERIGGRWVAQRQAFPWDYYGPGPKVILFRDDSLRGRYVHSSMPALAHRYLEDDCVMFVYPGTGQGYSYYTGVQCGRRERVHVGAVAEPADIYGANGVLLKPPGATTATMMSLEQILNEGLAAAER